MAVVKVTFSQPTNFPHEMVQAVTPAFDTLYRPQVEYRSTGIILVKLEKDRIVQLDLFGEAVPIEKMARVSAAMDWLGQKCGKHTVYLGSSLPAGSGAIRGIKIKEHPLDMLLKQPVQPPIRVEYVHWECR